MQIDWKEPWLTFCSLVATSNCEDVTVSQIHSLTYKSSIQPQHQEILDIEEDTADEQVSPWFESYIQHPLLKEYPIDSLLDLCHYTATEYSSVTPLRHHDSSDDSMVPISSYDYSQRILYCHDMRGGYQQDAAIHVILFRCLYS